MLDNELIFKTFGYYFENLSAKSSKPIKLICDYCGNVFDSSPKKRSYAHKKLAKDCCNNCKYIKREEIGPNPMYRPEVKEKIKQTLMERYGVESPLQSQIFKDKAKQTFIKNYGVEHVMQSDEYKQNYKKVMLEKYGVENASSADEVKEKRRQTCLEKFGTEYFLASDYAREKINETVKEKYGVDCVFQSEEIKEKSRNTNLQKRGVEYPTQCKEVLDKQRETNLKKYNVENVFQSEEIKEKIKNTNLKIYGVEYATQSQIVKDKQIKTMIKNGHMKLYDGKCMRELSEQINKKYTTFVEHVRNFGFEEALKMTTKRSSLEQLMSGWLNSIDVQFEEQFRVENRIADFYLPQYNLLLELDGNFWHSDIIIEDYKYHFNKKLLYEKYNYTSLFIMENEIVDKWEIVKSIILNKMGKSNRIYARECQIKEISFEEAKLFLNQNHLMGSGIGRSFALFHNNELMTVLQCKNRGGNIYEISRFSHLLNHSVIGGFSRLLKFAIDEIRPSKLINFVDKRYGTGKHLPDLGFKLVNCDPSFCWFAGNQVFHRMKFKGNTGYENGLSKIWDCGQAKYVRLFGS